MVDVKSITGRHLSKDEIIYVVTERCKEIGLNILSVTDEENLTSTKKAEVNFICNICNKPSKRQFEIIEYYKTLDCKECSDKRKQGRFKRKNLDKYSLQELIDEKYQEKEISFLVINDFNYKNNKQIIDIECTHCHQLDKSRIDVLLQGRKSCKCLQIRSKLELKVKKILEKYNLDFEKESGFKDLRHIQPLRFDYKIYLNNKIYLIECDGIQHFYPTFGKEAFERTTITDKIKNEYAEKNNIPLLRIKYDTKKSIEKLILEFINL